MAICAMALLVISRETYSGQETAGHLTHKVYDHIMSHDSISGLTRYYEYFTLMRFNDLV